MKIFELETSNTAFNELFSHRSLKDLQKEVYSVKGLRKELTDIYQKLSAYINANAQVKSDEFFVKTLEVLNNSRKYYADVLARRKAGGKVLPEPPKEEGKECKTFLLPPLTEGECREEKKGKVSYNKNSKFKFYLIKNNLL